MMKKELIVGIIFSIILISGCVEQKPICDPPYILVGTSCCLDQNDNKICDSDETTTVATTARTTTMTTIETTTTSPKVGFLEVDKEFFTSCRLSSLNQEWCSVKATDSTNEITINASSLGAQEHNTAELGVWFSNTGTYEIENITYSISCDETYPLSQKNVITKDDDTYRTLSTNIYFWCSGCQRWCECTPKKYGQVINKFDITDTTTFRIEFSGVDRLTESIDLECKLKIITEKPAAENSFDLIIHFSV